MIAGDFLSSYNKVEVGYRLLNNLFSRHFFTVCCAFVILVILVGSSDFSVGQDTVN
jgi:hypothetical protein